LAFVDSTIIAEMTQLLDAAYHCLKRSFELPPIAFSERILLRPVREYC